MNIIDKLDLVTGALFIMMAMFGGFAVGMCYILMKWNNSLRDMIDDLLYVDDDDGGSEFRDNEDRPIIPMDKLDLPRRQK